MSEIYSEDSTLFGAMAVWVLTEEDQKLSKEQLKILKSEVKEHNDFIIRGKNRVQEKVKQVRQDFSKAVFNW